MGDAAFGARTNAAALRPSFHTHADEADEHTVVLFRAEQRKESKAQSEMECSGRIGKELVECARDAEASGCTAEAVGGDTRHLRGTIKGPEGSPYEGGVFVVDIVITDQYPFAPPKMKFETRVWHPNVSSQTGAICLDILKDQWSPALTIKTALLSLQALLSSAEPDDPQDAEVAAMYKSDPEAFARTAKFWTDSYAKPSDGAGSEGEAVGRLTEMGFELEAVRDALARAGGSEEGALERLLGGS